MIFILFTRLKEMPQSIFLTNYFFRTQKKIFRDGLYLLYIAFTKNSLCFTVLLTTPTV